MFQLFTETQKKRRQAISFSRQAKLSTFYISSAVLADIVNDLWKQITQCGVFSSVLALSPCPGRPTSRTGWSQGDWADSEKIQSQLFFVGLQLFNAVDSSPRTRMSGAITRHRGRESEDAKSWVWRALSQRASPRGTELCRHGAWSRELGGGGGGRRA